MQNQRSRVNNVKIEEDIPGQGVPLRRGDRASIRLEIRLNGGDLVEVIDRYSLAIGKRQTIAAVEYALEGMCVGGRRKIKASPHLCYGSSGVAGKIPANAVLRLTIDLLSLA